MTASQSPNGRDKVSRKKPFAAWFKKVTNIKSSSGSKRGKKDRVPSPAAKSDKVPIVNQPGHDETASIQRIPSNGGDADKPLPAIQTDPPLQSQQPQEGSFVSNDEAHPPINGSGTHSSAPTLATDPDTITSEQSKSGISNAPAVSTLSGGGNSIFSSSNHSSRSLTTTLTTVQSAAPSSHLQNVPATNASTPTSAHHPGHSHHPSQGSTYFSHQYPTTPLSAVPQHLQAPPILSHLPTTYRSATANNLLSDNASILTLASSTHNTNRRNSLDTTASMRAIAPSSQWGGSRESLPLSVLSANTESQNTHQGQRPSVSGLTAGEVAGVSAPALSSERNSVYRGAADASSTRNLEKAGDGASLRTREADGSSLRGAPDGASMRSGMGGHGRNDSIAGSIGGIPPPREPVTTGTD